MTDLKTKVENALNETRTLILGVEILLAFDYQSVFMKGFDQLSPFAQSMQLMGLSALLVSVALLIAPAPYHRIVANGEASQDQVNFTNRATSTALLFLAVGLAVSIYVTFSKTSLRLAVTSALLFLALAMFFFYGLEFLARRRNRQLVKQVEQMKQSSEEDDQPGNTPLKERLRQVMTEIRVILPGIQALLGFQFAAILQDSFDKLPSQMQGLHFASLAMVAVSTVLLMSAPAYHRIVVQGEDSEEVVNYANRMILWALVFLALGF